VWVPMAGARGVQTTLEVILAWSLSVHSGETRVVDT
jgi:hypothetical protein